MNNPDVETLLAHRPFVEAVVRRLLRDEHLAEDVVQDTWLAALRAAPTPLRSAQAWLHRVAGNLARRSIRERARRERREHGAGREGAPGADALLERLESHRQVVEAVSALEAPYRRVILLRFYEDLPPREIARRTGEPSSTVRTRLQRALAMLRARLDREHGGDGRAWALALLPLLRPRVGAVGGLLAMKKVLVVAALLVLALVGFVSYGAFAPRDPPSRSSGGSVAVVEPEVAEAPAPGPPEPPDAEEADAEGACVARILLDDGAPLRDATLTVGGDPKLKGTTDADGRLRLVGTWDRSRELLLHASDGSWRMTTGMFVSTGTEIEATLVRGMTLATMVVTRDGGVPLPGARVVLGREDLAGNAGQAQAVWALAGTDGRVRIEMLPRARYRYEVLAKGFEGVLGTVDLGSEEFPGRFELAAARILTIRFEGLAAGFEGKEVTGFLQRSGGGVPQRFREKLDDRGEITIPAPPVGDHGLVVEAGEATPRLGARVAIPEGEIAPLVLKVPAGVPWTGVVRLADGAPWANRVIRIDGVAGEATTVRTGDDGSARVGMLAPGTKTVVAMIRDGWISIGAIDVPKTGTLHSDLRLPGTASFRARILRGGAPVRMPLVLVHETEKSLYGYQIPDGEGRISIDGLRAGSYSLETRGDSIAKLRTVALHDGEVTDLGDIDLGGAASVPVEVVVPEGTKLPKGFHGYASIAVPGEAPREQVALVWLDEQGRGVVADLPPGTHRLRVTTPGFAETEVVLTVPSSEPVRIALEPATPPSANR